jgi:hypothetical protein
MDVKGAAGFLDEPMDDIEPKARALPGAFGGEIRLEDFGKDFGWDSRPRIPDRQNHERRDVLKAFHIEEPILGAILEGR